MIAIVCGICAALLYVTNIFSYSMGVKHGRVVKEGGVPQVNPVKIVEQKKQVKEDKVKQDLQQEGLTNILNFGEPVG